MKHLLRALKKKPAEPLVYSHIVADQDKTKMVELLKVAAKKANEDQRALALSK